MKNGYRHWNKGIFVQGMLSGRDVHDIDDWRDRRTPSPTPAFARMAGSQEGCELYQARLAISLINMAWCAPTGRKVEAFMKRQ